MKNLTVFFIFLLFSIIEVHAQDVAIVEVRKNVSMSKMDKVYRHYFINGGMNAGLKKGTQVDVMRRVPIHDPMKNSSIGDLKVKVGVLEILHSEGKLSVGRLLSLDSPETRPVLDTEAFLVGDRLDLATIKEIPQMQAAVDIHSVELGKAAPPAEVEATPNKVQGSPGSVVASKKVVARQLASVNKSRKASTTKKLKR